MADGRGEQKYGTYLGSEREDIALTCMRKQTIQRRRPLERPSRLRLHKHRPGGGEIPAGVERGAGREEEAVGGEQGAEGTACGAADQGESRQLAIEGTKLGAWDVYILRQCRSRIFSMFSHGNHIQNCDTGWLLLRGARADDTQPACADRSSQTADHSRRVVQLQNLRPIAL